MSYNKATYLSLRILQVLQCNCHHTLKQTMYC